MPIVLVAGLAMFAFAMRWDTSDLERRTRRSDVAFWLHLAAAPMIAHSLFHMLGVFDAGDLNAFKAVLVLALYLAFAFVALAIDRRALLVSSLVYVLYALYSLFTRAGAVELGGALTALVIGSALLTLSAFWQPMRQRVVGMLGGLAEPGAAGAADRYSAISLTSRRSSGASTGASSWPRFSTAPCSAISAHMPCLPRNAGRFSMRTSGRSVARRKAAKTAASRLNSIA